MSTSQHKNSVYESQTDRWIKYGSNVGLSVLLVIALSIGLVYFAQKANARMDLTLGGSQSLKPQTATVLKDLKQHVTLVSLYTRPDNQPDAISQAQSVADLLDEYKTKNSNIEVKVIDPAKEKDKLEDLHQDFITRYGSQIKNYKDYLEKWKADYDQIKKLADTEAQAIGKFDTQQPDEVSMIVSTISDALPSRLASARKKVDHELKSKHPDYKLAAGEAKDQMELVSQLAGGIVEQSAEIQGSKLPAEFKKYFVDSLPHYQKMKEIADAAIADGSKLGEMKINQLEEALNIENPILVLGDSEWRILTPKQVWQDDTNIAAITNGAKVKPRFAGEQMVTTSIYSLMNPKKQKVCFVRPGGAPLCEASSLQFTPAGPRLSQGGPLSQFAEHLREYNFDVLEKDLSGMYAMQAQMQQRPVAPEPTDDDIKDALWIVLDFPAGDPERPTPSVMGPKLREHLEHGGSALVLCESHGDDLGTAFVDWGVTLNSGIVAVHDTEKLSDSAEKDWLEEAKARPFIWDIRKYGEHELLAPIQNLDMLMVEPVCVSASATPPKGCTVTQILPFSQNTGKGTWGTTNLEDLEKKPGFHKDKGDLAAPIFGGAIVEKKGAGRLVVIGSIRAFINNFLRFPDPKLAQRDPPIIINRFPGNLELATNSVFWLAHLEPMIAISPAAMDVSRIADMSPGMLNFWRIGVLLIILPGAVLVAGALVYVARRD